MIAGAPDHVGRHQLSPSNTGSPSRTPTRKTNGTSTRPSAPSILKGTCPTSRPVSQVSRPARMEQYGHLQLPRLTS